MAEGGEGGEDEIQFLRTEDEVVLQCIANIHKEQRKFCLAAEGLGNRLCFLEPTSEAKVRLVTCPAPSPKQSFKEWGFQKMVMRMVEKCERTHLLIFIF
uniref:Inositol 1,4,5-trisphosphate/ryanodine receptor domain-containing protein n=1 Tax=Pipistrellus kuhlii TaxID=59472 RepID=A0A7J8B1X6_PIPKU|nr:hypothetical protein mPipKuh1_007727 [Pipistrellus kuhlii]